MYYGLVADAIEFTIRYMCSIENCALYEIFYKRKKGITIVLYGASSHNIATIVVYVFTQAVLRNQT